MFHRLKHHLDRVSGKVTDLPPKLQRWIGSHKDLPHFARANEHTPQGERLVLSSCRPRPADFLPWWLALTSLEVIGERVRSINLFDKVEEVFLCAQFDADRILLHIEFPDPPSLVVLYLPVPPAEISTADIDIVEWMPPFPQILETGFLIEFIDGAQEIDVRPWVNGIWHAKAAIEALFQEHK